VLFHSSMFIFGFLPVVVAGYVLLGRAYGRAAALGWLLAASLIFYGSWSLSFLPILLGSAAFNYAAGRAIRGLRTRGRAATVAAGVGIAVNLATLGYFKYANFFIENVNLAFSATGSSLPHLNVILPLGLSFFTFQQIAFLIDTVNGRDEKPTFLQYLLFVAFFPTVTSGPISNTQEIIPQLREKKAFGITFDAFAAGVTLFSLGLFKKLVLADTLAPYVDSVFDAASRGLAVGTVDAWLGTTAYFLQLYFDFSGYCDMALGIGALLGIRLPLNFNSPLKATSVIDYWRRWHMTLTRFITAYLYMPMAVRLSRHCRRHGHGSIARFLLSVALPAVLTFVLAGLWHGAGWTFVLFGLVWGVALSINNAWREARLPPLPPVAGWMLTMSVALLSMALFRADNLAAAGTVIGAMLGATGVGSSLVSARLLLPLLIVLVAALLLAPNTQQLLRNYAITGDAIDEPESGWRGGIAWRYGAAGVICTATVFLVAVLSITGTSHFLYYKF
jgi:alginate O-acetyltransferase complex protein AlgI